MKIQHLIPLLLLVGYCTVSAQTNNTKIWAWQKPINRDSMGVPIGTLGFPIGSYLTIEGVKSTPTPIPKGGGDLCLVDTVNGSKLSNPVTIEIETARGWSNGVHFVFKGYETMEMCGSPPGAEEAAREAGQKDFVESQIVWQLEFYFVVTSIVIPKEATK